MSTPQTFIVYWSRGPMDNPEQGDFTVEARSVHEAAGLAEVAGLAPENIDAICTKTFQKDMLP